MKFGFYSVPGSSAGISIARLGLAFFRFYDPLDAKLPTELLDDPSFIPISFISLFYGLGSFFFTEEVLEALERRSC